MKRAAKRTEAARTQGSETGCKPRTSSEPIRWADHQGLDRFCHDLLRNARSPKRICTYPVVLRSRGAFGGAFLPAKYGMDVVKVRHRRPESLAKPAKCCDSRSPWSEWGSGGRGLTPPLRPYPTRVRKRVKSRRPDFVKTAPASSCPERSFSLLPTLPHGLIDH